MASLSDRRRAARRPLLRRRLAHSAQIDNRTTAALLVDRLRSHGAELAVSSEGLTCWFMEPGVGTRPATENPAERFMTDGAMRELWHLIKNLPGARAAVAQYVAEHSYPQ